MSGAHDVARDAAQRLLDAVEDTSVGAYGEPVQSYGEEIRTIAKYLGLDVKEE
jgi:hypothetical protein